MASEPLTVHLAGCFAGTVDYHRGRLRLTYDPAYAAQPDAVPLSLSLPFSEPVITGPRVSGWLDGVLPGNQSVRRRWAARHHAASHSPFDLLSTPIGLDCPGALQTVPQSLAADLTARPGGVDWLSPDQFADLVAQLVNEQTWQRADGRTAWSLAGAQSKTALVHDAGRWGEPWGTTPSTHLLKPSMTDLAGQAVNEHLCLQAARYCGLEAAHSEALSVAGHTVIAVRRYDRLPGPDGTVCRVHQEDLHQACGQPDVAIYQTDGGGHSIAGLGRLIADHSAQPDTDRRRFFDALAFNWLICNVDAHSKNYGLLLEPAAVRLAPLYDLWSMQPYSPDLIGSHAMAMAAQPDARILAAANPAAWTATARAVGLQPSHGPERVAQLAGALPDAFDRAADKLAPTVRSEPIVAELTVHMRTRAPVCREALAHPSPVQQRGRSI